MYLYNPARLGPIVVLASILALGSIGCELIDYSPHQDDLPEGADQLTAKNIERIQRQVPGEEIRFAFITDTQNFYEEADAFVDHVNARDDIDFVIHGGDIIEFGIIQEYEWIYEIFERLDVPYVTVVGNHDLRGNGGRLYDQIYGPRNYSFTWGDKKLIFLDTNSRHYGFDGRVPDLEWLAAELTPGHFKGAVVVGHAPPDHPDFDSELEFAYADLLEKNRRVVQLSLHGHTHKFSAGRPYGDVFYLVGEDTSERSYLVVSLADDDVSYERVEF